ncbi:MAG TPA: GNAT family N-acetyltransferase [Jatrophihabitans sp.]|nr:GNAT family N-acetyltransferase [Jatrophihabitans sp.]
MTLTWRPLTVEDAEAWATLVNLLAEVDGTEEFYEPEDLREELQHQEGFDPALDTLAAWQGDLLAGFVALWVSGNLDADGRATVGIGGGVHPEFRGRGIGRELMDRIERRGLAVAAERHPGAETYLRASGGLAGASVRPLLEHRGYELARYFHELERPLSGGLTTSGGVRPFDAELAEQVRLAHNEAFAGHWGSSPRTEANWRELVASRAFRPGFSFVSLAADGLVDAYVIARQWVEGELYVELVGTRPRARGRGLARACLAASLAAAGAAGLTKAALTVDGENGTGAGRLYASMGFEPVRVVASYRKLAFAGR